MHGTLTEPFRNELPCYQARDKFPSPIPCLWTKHLALEGILDKPFSQTRDESQILIAEMEADEPHLWVRPLFNY
jgi:hypothetical protein